MFLKGISKNFAFHENLMISFVKSEKLSILRSILFEKLFLNNTGIFQGDPE